MDGWITIGTELDDSKFDRQIANLEKKMQKEEDKKIIIEAKLTDQERQLENQRQKVDELADAYQRLKDVQQTIESGTATPRQFLEYQGLTSQYGSLEQLGETFDKALTSQDLMEQKVEQTKIKYGEIDANVKDIKAKIEGINLQKQQNEINKMKDGFKNVSSSLQNAVKRAGKLALAVFGIRSAYLALRRASSDLASYDKEYATNLEYIRFVLTQAIAPVLRAIVQLTATVLRFINMIVNALFGINLFSSGSAENFRKMKASAGGVSKAVKEIKKQLAGFDEMNVLTSQSDTGTSAGAGGVGIPDFDLSELEGEPPTWLQWIVDHKGDILGIIAGILAGITALKVSSLLKSLELIKKGLTGIKALGIGIMIWGIVSAVIALIDYINDPSWEHFGDVIKGIGLAILGLGIIMGNVPAIVAGAIILIVGIIVKYWDKIKAFFQRGIDWLSEKSDWVHKKFGNTIGAIYDYFVERIKLALNFVDGFFKSIRQVFDGIIQFIRGVFTGNWEEAWNGLKKIVTGVFNNIVNVFNNIIGILQAKLKLWGEVAGNAFGGAFKAVVNAVLRVVENVLNAPIRAINGLIDIVRAIPGLGGLQRLNTFNLPRLAVGGIVNMPNKGTLVGGALAGESGREGVVPLTDQQAMAELGREIGKNVLVNLTNITQMNGRVIGRELKQIQNEQNFAYNM